MAYHTSSSSSPRHTKPLLVIVSFTVSLLLFTLSVRLQPNNPLPSHHPTASPVTTPEWFRLVSKDFNKRIKIALVNVDPAYVSGLDVDAVTVQYDGISKSLTWQDFFPEWIDEDEKWSPPACPEVPLPERMETEYGDVDVVVVRAPCGNWTGREGVRDLGRLQANLVAAHLAVSGGGWASWPYAQPPVYVVFVGPGGPMWEIFRCDDLVMKGEDYSVYLPELTRLKQKTLMPVGTCELPPGIARTESYRWRYFKAQTSHIHRKEAYVTMLHSSEAYVCGAIALAQSIKLTYSDKALILLADDHVSNKSREALVSAGWKIKNITRIRSPHAGKNAYNEWNYSKLRIWQLTEFDTVMFIDSDLLVLKNLDKFFRYPELSASGNSMTMFNSGLMIIEPSECMFQTLMKKTRELPSYNGGDQGFLNEVFTWWHRFPTKLNYLKMFEDPRNAEHEVARGDVYALHFLGLKPWVCYRDYDCNWDMADRQVFASDSAHRRWFEVYDTLPKKLRPFCGLTAKGDWRIRKWRRIAKKANLADGHWKIRVRDQRALPLKKQVNFS